MALTAQLKAFGCSSPSAKPTAFIAHSLGGVVLKQSLVQMANSAEPDVFLLSQVREILLFGVPNRGMRIAHLLPMVSKQPNEALLNQLSEDSHYLELLDEQFGGISFLRGTHLISIFETLESQIPQVMIARSNLTRRH